MSGWGHFLIWHNYIHNFSHNSTTALSRLTKLTIIFILMFKPLSPQYILQSIWWNQGQQGPLHLVMTSLDSVLLSPLLPWLVFQLFSCCRNYSDFFWNWTRGWQTVRASKLLLYISGDKRQTLRLFAYLMTEYFSKSLETIESHMLRSRNYSKLSFACLFHGALIQ